MSKQDLELRRIQTQAMLDLGRIRQATERHVGGFLEEAGLVDITPAQANALLALFTARRPLTAAQLARALCLSEVTVGRFVRAMEDAGWIERSRDPDDSRALLLRPTAQARARLPGFIEVNNRILDAAFAGVTRGEIEAFAALIARIRNQLDPDET